MKKVILTIFLAFTAAVYAGAATPTAARDTSQVIPIIGGDGSGLGGGGLDRYRSAGYKLALFRSSVIITLLSLSLKISGWWNSSLRTLPPGNILTVNSMPFRALIQSQYPALQAIIRSCSLYQMAGVVTDVLN